MDDTEKLQAPPSRRPERWWEAPAAVVLVVAWVSLMKSLSSETPMALVHRLSSSSASAVVALLLLTTFLWFVSFFALPLWIAWLTDARSTSPLHAYVPLRPPDLSSCRKTMSTIKATSRDAKASIIPGSEAVSQSLDGVITLIMRDFVTSWHTPLLSGSPNAALAPSNGDQDFPAMVEHTIRSSLSALIALGSTLDVPMLAVCKVLPVLTSHLKLFEEAELKWRGSGSAAEIAEGEEGDVFLASLYNGGILHPAVGDIASPDTKMSELEHLRKVAVIVVEHILPKRESRSPGVRIVVRELIACTILKPMVEALSDPDTLNALLEEKASAALQEQKLVSRLREALDKEGSNARLPTLVTVDSSRSSSGTSTPHRKESGRVSAASSYDSFMDEISNSKSILEARRTKNGLLQQIRKTKTALAAEDGEGERKKKQLDVYLGRLQAAIEAVDRRIHQLGMSSSIQEHKGSPPTAPDLDDLARNISLRDVLTSSSAISHFLDFTEGRQKAIFVQFWLSVNSFKNPLEVAESDSEEEGGQTRLRPARAQPSSSLQPAHEDEIMTLREDLLFFVENYYRSHQIAAVVKQKHIAVAEDFLHTHQAEAPRVTNRSVVLARRSVLKAQKQIYDEMVDEDWPAFQTSHAWHRALEDLQRERAQLAPTATFSPSTFLEHPAARSELPSPPSVSRAASHAHLFGSASPTAALFADKESEQDVDLKSPQLRAKSSLDQLMGGKGGMFEGLSGRAPLFREALFDEDDTQSGIEDEHGSRVKQSPVRVEKIDAIESVLASIIQEDLPLEQVKASRPESRQASIRSTPSSRTKEILFLGEDEEQSRDQVTTPLQRATGLVDVPSQVKRINDSTKRLRDQEELLLALMRKAELTGSSAKETRLLQKSMETVSRELRELKFEMRALRALPAPMESSEGEIVPGRVRIRIQHANVGQDSDGKEYATYLIEVSQLTQQQQESAGADDSIVAQSGWVVSRRYNEFYALHNRLRDHFAQVRALDHVFPGKRLAGLVSAALVESRRSSLQNYLQALIKWDVVCKSNELKSFLSQSVAVFTVDALSTISPELLHPSARPPTGHLGLVSRLYRGMTGVAEGLDDLLFGPSMFEVIVNRLSNGVVDLVGFNEMERILAGATTSSAAEIKEATQVTNTAFTGPICDAIIELFQLKLEGNWFRRQAVIIVAQQALGGTIERKLRQTVAALLDANALVGHIAKVRSTLWPNGKFKQPDPKRSVQEKRLRRDNALRTLSTLIPNLASNFIGRDNARRAARRSWAVLQNKRLNKHILYTIIDVVLLDLFPQAEAKSGSTNTYPEQSR